MLLGLLAIVALAAPSTQLLSKQRAHAVAQRVSAEACTKTSWCARATVVPARDCRRRSRAEVECRIVFVRDGDDLRCEGLVSVRRPRRGRLELAIGWPVCPTSPAGLTLGHDDASRPSS